MLQGPAEPVELSDQELVTAAAGDHQRLVQSGAPDEFAGRLVDVDPPARVSLDDPYDVARLLGSLREAGAQDQAAALASRAAAFVRLS